MDHNVEERFAKLEHRLARQERAHSRVAHLLADAIGMLAEDDVSGAMGIVGAFAPPSDLDFASMELGSAVDQLERAREAVSKTEHPHAKQAMATLERAVAIVKALSAMFDETLVEEKSIKTENET